MDEPMLEKMQALVTAQQAGAVQTQAMVAQMRELILGLAGRIESLERVLAQRVTVSHEQVKAVNAAIRRRARTLTEANGLTAAQETRLRAAIKKEVLTGYAVRDLHDLPANAFERAVKDIEVWNSFRLLRELRKEAADG